jgi:hypothetical protein
MKKIYLLLIALCVFAFNMNAQKWVSTTPENKKVVLEEYTGIHCGYCPDGHKKANDLAATNPGKVFIVNIHAGTYATPSTGEPDFRTSEGNALNTAAAVTGYPSGSINRSTTPWGQSRANWATLASGILSQPSPVNVAVKSAVDMNTRTLTTEVEVYYTSASTASKNYLTVMLLESDYPGYQSDYGNYNPDNWCSNGLYKHNHFLRMVLSQNGANGEALDTTTSGKYYYKKYVTTLPATLVNVEYYLSKLTVVAFVSESQAQIYNGAEADVTYDNSKVADLSMVNKTALPSGYCFTEIYPKLEVTNNSDKTITSFDVIAKIGTDNYPKTYTGSLASGAKVTVDMGTIPFSAKGAYSINFSGFSNVNGGVIVEDNGLCDNSFKYSSIGFTEKAFTTFYGGFNSVTLPSNLALDYTNNTKFYVNIPTTGNCGANNTKGAVRYALHSTQSVAGKPADILFGEADLTAATKPSLGFFYAYSDDAYGGTAPVVKVFISEDCGVTWKEQYSLTCVQTGNPATHGNWYVPTSSEYIWVSAELPDAKAKDVLIKLQAIPGTSGNALYIDEVTLSATTAINDITSKYGINIYPNPLQDEAKIEFSLENEANVSFELLNSLGQSVLTIDNESYNTGINSISFNTSDLAQGCYVAKLTIDGNVYTSKLVK